MATVQDLISSSLRQLGVLAAGEVPAYQDSADGLVSLNDLMDQWAAERLQIYALVNTTWPLVPSQATYTVGTGGNVNIARPVFIDHVNLIDTSPTPDAEFPLNPLTDDAWSGIPFKALTGAIPSDWWYQPTFPLGTLYLWPIPTGATLRGSIYAPQAVTQFASLSTAASLPPGYLRMLRSNLALELAPDYGVEPSPVLVRMAEESKAVVKRANFRMSDLSFPAEALIGGGGSWDIYTGP